MKHFILVLFRQQKRLSKWTLMKCIHNLYWTSWSFKINKTFNFESKYLYRVLNRKRKILENLLQYKIALRTRNTIGLPEAKSTICCMANLILPRNCSWKKNGKTLFHQIFSFIFKIIIVLKSYFIHKLSFSSS